MKPIKAKNNKKKPSIVVLKPKEATLHSLKVNSGVQALALVIQEERV
jgi:hypothetical protein